MITPDSIFNTHCHNYYPHTFRNVQSRTALTTIDQRRCVSQSARLSSLTTPTMKEEETQKYPQRKLLVLTNPQSPHQAAKPTSAIASSRGFIPTVKYKYFNYNPQKGSSIYYGLKHALKNLENKRVTVGSSHQKNRKTADEDVQFETKTATDLKASHGNTNSANVKQANCPHPSVDQEAIRQVYVAEARKMFQIGTKIKLEEIYDSHNNRACFSACERQKHNINVNKNTKSLKISTIANTPRKQWSSNLAISKSETQFQTIQIEPKQGFAIFGKQFGSQLEHQRTNINTSVLKVQNSQPAQNELTAIYTPILRNSCQQQRTQINSSIHKKACIHVQQLKLNSPANNEFQQHQKRVGEPLKATSGEPQALKSYRINQNHLKSFIQRFENSKNKNEDIHFNVKDKGRAWKDIPLEQEEGGQMKKMHPSS